MGSAQLGRREKREHGLFIWERRRGIPAAKCLRLLYRMADFQTTVSFWIVVQIMGYMKAAGPAARPDLLTWATLLLTWSQPLGPGDSCDLRVIDAEGVRTSARHEPGASPSCSSLWLPAAGYFRLYFCDCASGSNLNFHTLIHIWTHIKFTIPIFSGANSQVHCFIYITTSHDFITIKLL